MGCKHQARETADEGENDHRQKRVRVCRDNGQQGNVQAIAIDDQEATLEASKTNLRATRDSESEGISFKLEPSAVSALRWVRRPDTCH